MQYFFNILKEDFNKDNIEELKKKYQAIKCTAKEWEDLHNGKKIRIPTDFKESHPEIYLGDDIKQVRCIHCGCPIFVRNITEKNRYLFCGEDSYEDYIDTIDIKYSFYRCAECNNIIRR